MYIDDTKLVAKNEKKIGNPNINSENVQSRYKMGIWHRKMRHANNKKRQTKYDVKSQTTKSNNQNAQRKGNRRIFRNIGS